MSGYSDDAINALMAHDWPGNIRELQNKVKSAALMCEGKVINADDLMLAVSDEDDAQFELNLKTTREKAERAAIVKALSFCDGNLTSAAKHLGITRPTLYYLLDKYSLKQEG